MNRRSENSCKCDAQIFYEHYHERIEKTFKTIYTENDDSCRPKFEEHFITTTEETAPKRVSFSTEQVAEESIEHNLENDTIYPEETPQKTLLQEDDDLEIITILPPIPEEQDFISQTSKSSAKSNQNDDTELITYDTDQFMTQYTYLETETQFSKNPLKETSKENIDTQSLNKTRFQLNSPRSSLKTSISRVDYLRLQVSKKRLSREIEEHKQKIRVLLKEVENKINKSENMHGRRNSIKRMSKLIEDMKEEINRLLDTIKEKEFELNLLQNKYRSQLSIKPISQISIVKGSDKVLPKTNSETSKKSVKSLISQIHTLSFAEQEEDTFIESNLEVNTLESSFQEASGEYTRTVSTAAEEIVEFVEDNEQYEDEEYETYLYNDDFFNEIWRKIKEIQYAREYLETYLHEHETEEEREQEIMENERQEETYGEDIFISTSEEKARQYLSSHKIDQFFHYIGAKLVVSTPDNPIDFIIDFLDKCNDYRNGKCQPPLLFENKHVESLYNSLDPMGFGEIDINQYHAGMFTLGLTDFQKIPEFMDKVMISKEVFMSDAIKYLKIQLDEMIDLSSIFIYAEQCRVCSTRSG